MLSLAEKVTLVKSILCSLPIHVESNAVVPNEFMGWFNKILRTLFWVIKHMVEDYIQWLGRLRVNSRPWVASAFQMLENWWEALMSKLADKLVMTLINGCCLEC